MGARVGRGPPSFAARAIVAASLVNASTFAATSVPVFTDGEGGYAAFRIPGIAATPTALVAFAEGRKFACGDFDGQHDIVAKRSLDGGQSFGALIVVADATTLAACPEPSERGACEIWDPTPLFVPATGELLLLATFTNAPNSTAARLDGMQDLLLWRSADGGASWGPPENLTSAVGGRPLPALGNGHAIALRASGRLVFPATVLTADVRASTAYLSDDNGRSFRRGAGVVAHPSAEADIVERADGSLLINLRDLSPNATCGDAQNGGRCRWFATSEDGGESWSAAVPRPDLLDPGCKGGIAALSGGQRLLLVNDESTTNARVNVTLRLSEDGGATWPAAARVSAEGGYADVIAFNVTSGAEMAGVIFENTTCRIRFAAVDPNSLGQAHAQPSQ